MLSWGLQTLMWALETCRAKPWPCVTFISPSGNKTNYSLIIEMVTRMYPWRSVLQPLALNGAGCAASGQFVCFWIFKIPWCCNFCSLSPNLPQGCATPVVKSSAAQRDEGAPKNRALIVEDLSPFSLTGTSQTKGFPNPPLFLTIFEPGTSGRRA